MGVDVNPNSVVAEVIEVAIIRTINYKSQAYHTRGEFARYLSLQSSRFFTY